LTLGQCLSHVSSTRIAARDLRRALEPRGLDNPTSRLLKFSPWTMSAPPLALRLAALSRPTRYHRNSAFRERQHAATDRADYRALAKDHTSNCPRTSGLAEQAIFNWENSERAKFANQLQNGRRRACHPRREKPMPDRYLAGAPEEIRTPDPQIRRKRSRLRRPEHILAKPGNPLENL
jgi:hypothetical protein